MSIRSLILILDVLMMVLLTREQCAITLLMSDIE